MKKGEILLRAGAVLDERETLVAHRLEWMGKTMQNDGKDWTFDQLCLCAETLSANGDLKETLRKLEKQFLFQDIF